MKDTLFDIGYWLLPLVVSVCSFFGGLYMLWFLSEVWEYAGTFGSFVFGALLFMGGVLLPFFVSPVMLVAFFDEL